MLSLLYTHPTKNAITFCEIFKGTTSKSKQSAPNRTGKQRAPHRVGHALFGRNDRDPAFSALPKGKATLAKVVEAGEQAVPADEGDLSLPPE